MHNRRTIILGIGSFLLLAGLAVPARAADDRDFRTITKSFPAANLQGFRVEGRVGTIRVRATNATDVSLKLELEARREGGWLFGSKGDPRDVELDESSAGGTLRLSLRGDRKGLNETWTLTVPARLAAELKLDVGDVEARDVEGGVRISVNVGNLDLDIPRGAIDAKVNVGDIKARTGTDAYDDVRLESNVGGADLRVGSQHISSSNRRRYGPGEDVRWSGTGRDRIRMEVNVGDASLVIAKTRV